jgi:hypothetical protein
VPVAVDADGVVALQQQGLDVVRARLQQRLVLIIMLEAVGVLAIAAIGGPPRGLHVGGAPGFGAEGAQGGGGMEGARPHLHVIGLENHAALARPEGVQGEDDVLEAFRLIRGVMDCHGPLVKTDAPQQ